MPLDRPEQLALHQPELLGERRYRPAGHDQSGLGKRRAVDRDGGSRAFAPSLHGGEDRARRLVPDDRRLRPRLFHQGRRRRRCRFERLDRLGGRLL